MEDNKMKGPFNNFYSLDPTQIDLDFNLENEMEITQFLFGKDPLLINKIKKISEATFPIYDHSKKFVGNCVAIAKDLVLVSGHCVDSQSTFVGDFGRGDVVFDGSDGQGIDRLDFKILKVDDLKNHSFTPVTLDVVSSIGSSIQIYFKRQEKSRLIQWVKPFESEESRYATRSDHASSNTSPGESGAPRMSLSTGYVHAIHQGESEGLKINDIYLALERAAKSSSHQQRKNAEAILQRITVANLEMRYLSFSTVGLNSGAVAEEKPRIIDDITLSIQINRKNLNFTFGYREVGEGRGNRQIVIHQKTIADTSATYDISPNPHRNSRYNKDGQKEFYRVLAEALGSYYIEHSNQFPNEGTIKALKEEYTLTKVS